MTMHKLIISSCLFVAPLLSHADNWIETSNNYTHSQIAIDGKFHPEMGSFVGMAEFDSQCANITTNAQTDYLNALKLQKTQLEKALTTETSEPVKQDLAILIQDIELTLEDDRLDKKYFLPWTDVAQTVFQGLSALLDEQMPRSRQEAALNRLACYVGKADQEALSLQAQAEFDKAISNSALMGPAKEKVQQALDRTPTLIKGLRELFADHNLAQATENLDLLEQQLTAYSNWVNTNVIPKTRTDYRLPADIYALKLRQMGIDIAPELLIQRAKAAFMETRANMQALAPQVARAEKIKANDYRSVIKALKKDSISNRKIEKHYRDINKQLEAAITKHGIVDLPKRDMIMRLGSEAESAASPAPHMLPPPFIGNTGEQGQFVLTTGNPALTGDAAYNDFNFDAVAYTLSAHEGRPGHELQFSAMLEQGVSLARVYYAFNSVNVEGWALYAEAEVLPFHPLKGQLIGLQHRLLRNARAMLDPMLNLGLATPDQAYDILLNDVGLSKAMAKQEVDRYTLRMPGQAGSYFYGYSRLLEIRAGAELVLADKFDRLAFNNFVLSQGLIPPSLMEKAVNEQFIPKYL
ncbi:DUF885 domain-containing protein [Simiduia litorea]|uniref:DUF885 domain-containing protein n=1 Tax=Simiduia litorea TaxID=1435348 RepID=UPI0036F1F7E4